MSVVFIFHLANNDMDGHLTMVTISAEL